MVIEDGRTQNQLRPLACSRNILHRPHGSVSWTQGKVEKEDEMILKRTLHRICVLTVNPNTTTSVIIQVVNDDGSLLPCAINAACAALVDAGIPMKHLAADNGYVILDPNKVEEKVNQKTFSLSIIVLSWLVLLTWNCNVRENNGTRLFSISKLDSLSSSGRRNRACITCDSYIGYVWSNVSG